MAGTRRTLAGLVRRWWPAAALAMAGTLAGLGYAVLAAPSYVAKAYVIVVTTDPADSTSAVNYAQAYARIISQGEVVAGAAVASHGTASATQLRTHVQAGSSPDAPVIEVSGSARTARRSADLANLMAASLVATANRQSVATRMRLTLLSAATPPAGAASPRRSLDVAVGLAVGLLLGGLATLARSGHADPAESPAPAGARERIAVTARSGRRRQEDTVGERQIGQRGEAAPPVRIRNHGRRTPPPDPHPREDPETP